MEIKSRQAFMAILKGSIFPVVLGAAVFVMFKLSRARYGMGKDAYTDKIFSAFLVLFITYWVYRIAVVLFGWYAVNVAAKTKTELDDKFVPLFQRMTVTIIWAIGLIMLLSRFGVNINALVATLGVGSLAIALAAQDTIANIISGFLLMIDRPFSIGDDIKLPSGERVRVIEIGVRRSKFVLEDEAIVIVPNLELSKSKIINYTYKGAKK
ncbi:MAG: mechanosensitive ion channel domain-containing protein [bacterium]